MGELGLPLISGLAGNAMTISIYQSLIVPGVLNTKGVIFLGGCNLSTKFIPRLYMKRASF